MKNVILLFVLLASGCAPYAQVQIDLLRQVDAGLAKTQSSLDESSQVIAAYHELRRKQLDEAFDLDVRQRDALDADWVIEHRKAYAAAVDLLSAARSRNEQAAQVDRQNLASLRDAISRIIWLQQLQLQLIPSPGEKP
jgi:hypothetical protein